MSSTIDELPDLPGIEEVKVEYKSPAFLVGCIIGLVVFILCWIYRGIVHSLKTLLGIAAWTSLVQSLLSHETKIDYNGLHYEQPFRRKKIKWTEVIDARITSNKHCRYTVDFTGDKRVISILIDGEDYPRIIASIWQHLRRHGKAENFTLPDTVLSMWADIPNDIPEEMDFTGKPQGESNWRIINRLRHDTISQEIIGASSKELKGMYWNQNPKVMNWNEMTDADFTFENNEDTLALYYGDTDEGEVSIACPENTDGTYNTDNARFLLAVVRRARQAINKPIHIPEWLRDTCGIQLPGRQ